MTTTQAVPSMGELQEREHGIGHDYAKGSPHIRHHTIRDRLITGLHALVQEVIDRNGQCRVLELGAGHGTFTDHLLAAGAHVTVTEMSEPSVRFLESRFRRNPNVTVVHDQDGTAACQAGLVDAVVCVSVLHHIPDYLGTVKQLVENIAPGGAFLSAQDPLWYPRRSRMSMSLDRNAYFLWRLGQGQFRRGLSTRLRRMRGVYDDTNEADMANTTSSATAWTRKPCGIFSHRPSRRSKYSVTGPPNRDCFRPPEHGSVHRRPSASSPGAADDAPRRPTR
jgi:phospholipid N-methyltransferase